MQQASYAKLCQQHPFTRYQTYKEIARSHTASTWLSLIEFDSTLIPFFFFNMNTLFFKLPLPRHWFLVRDSQIMRKFGWVRHRNNTVRVSRDSRLASRILPSIHYVWALAAPDVSSRAPHAARFVFSPLTTKLLQHVSITR